ncbi:PglL family O-oligosaccharyltransferase [Thiohalomonas denitrificans]|nr:O-antigen ligase family protein [Thiohalomonas denitrificans]
MHTIDRASQHFPARRYIFALAGLLMVTSWLIPNHYLPWSAFYNEFIAAVALVMLAVATFTGVSHSNDHQVGTRIPRGVLALLLLAAIPPLQYGFGLITFSGDAWTASLYLAGLALAYAVGFALAGENREVTARTMAWVFLIGALLSLFLAAAQWLHLNLGVWLVDIAPRGRPSANLAQPNNLATLFCLGLAAAIYLNARGHMGRPVVTLCSLLLFAGIAMTASRTPLIIGLVILGWTLLQRRQVGITLSSLQITTGFAVLVSLWFIWPVLTDAIHLNSVPSGAPAASLQIRSESGLRPTIWLQLLDAAVRAPLFGYGWNQVTLAQVAVAGDHGPSVMVEHSHNIALDLLLWNGLLVGGAILLLLGGWFLSRMKRRQNLESWFGLLVLMAVFTHGMLEFPLEYTYFLFPLGVCAGIVDRSVDIRGMAMPAWSKPAVLLASGLALVLVVSEYRLLEADFRHMRFEGIGIEARKPADQTTPAKILTQLSAYTRYARTEAYADMTAEQIAWMGRVAHRYPHPPALFRYALALALNQRYTEAAHQLLLLEKLHPRQRDSAKASWAAAVHQYPNLSQVKLPD